MIYALIIVFVVLAMYLRTLNYGYTIDDMDVFKKSLNKPKPKNLRQQIWWSFKGEYYKDRKIDHSLVLALHLLNCLLVYYAFGHNQISFATALIFAIHPAGNQCSVWLSGKFYSMSTAWVLLMYSFQWLVPVLYYLSFILGGFSSVLSPVIFILGPKWFWIAMIPIMAWLHRKHIKTVIGYKLSVTPEMTKKVSLIRVILYFKSLGYYTWLCLFPLRLGVYHNYLYTYGLTKDETDHWHKPDIYALFGLGVAGSLVYLLIYHTAEPYTFGLFWFIALLSQWCNFPITIQQSIAERYLYLPLAGFCYCLVNLINIIPDPRVKWFLLGAFIIGYFVRMLIHITAYRNLYTQIEYNLVNFPDCYACWTWKGQEEKNRGAFFTALEAWFNGWKLRKHDFRLNNNIAVLLTEMGEFDQALEFMKIAEAAIPPDCKEDGNRYITQARNRILECKRQVELANRKGRIILPGGRG